MNYPLRAVIAIALGTGLAAAAQAEGTYSPGAASARTIHNAPAKPLQKVSADTQRVQQVKMAQEQLKSEGLYKGRIDGVMNHRTRLAIARFQKQNGLPRTASLDRNTLDRLTGGQRSTSGLGVGSSMPDNPKAMNGPNVAPAPTTPPTTSSQTGAGGASAPSNPTTKY